ncbi:hypothetical protein QUB37_25905 [Microcoleus sp. AT3-A2]
MAIPSGFSPEDYLALERDHTVRHEYRRGLVYAMAGVAMTTAVSVLIL